MNWGQIGSAVLGIGTSLFQARGQRKAANAERDAANRAQDLLERQYADTDRRLAPYVAAGAQDVNNQSDLEFLGGLYNRYRGELPKRETLLGAVEQLQSGRRTREDMERVISTAPSAVDYYLENNGQIGNADALQQLQNILGLAGDDAQAAAVESVRNSPLYNSLMQQATDTVLQNASATGGLRGGNTQEALGGLGANLLNSLVTDRTNSLSNLVNLGQNTAVRQAAAATEYGKNAGAYITAAGEAAANGRAANYGSTLNAINSGIKGASMPEDNNPVNSILKAFGF